MSLPAISGPIILDSEGLSRAVRRDPIIRAVILNAYLTDEPVMVSALTLVEVTHPRIGRAALDWVVSRLEVVPADLTIAKTASALLASAKLHGHQHAVDAVVCATALAAGGIPSVYTSDPKDFEKLLGNKARIIPLT